MSETIPLETASARLEQLVRALGPGDEIVLTQNDKPVARILPPTPPAKRQAGLWKGKLTIISEDDDHLEDFKDYMP